MAKIVILLSLLLGLESAVNARESRGKVLLFGGNGLVGGAVTQALVSAGYDVTLASRGTWYWDTDRTIKPFVRHVHCDRYSVFLMASSISRECPDLVEFVESVDRFEAVIDFSAYEAAVIDQALEVLGDKVGVYVYISSDSVYEVCDKSHQELTREEDAVRPSDKSRREELARADDYGNKKFLCEEALERARQTGGPPYIFLRLPDVLGGRDNIDRWWIYQLWVKLASFMNKPITYPKRFENQKLGFVFSEDVGRGVVQILEKKDPSLLNKPYNLACEEHMTLPELIVSIGKNIGAEDAPLEADNADDAYYLFPSVLKGPLDITRAKKAFGFSPTPILEVIKVSAKFFELAIRDDKYVRHQKKVMSKLGKDVFKDREKMKEAIRTLYPDRFHSDRQEKKDEL